MKNLLLVCLSVLCLNGCATKKNEVTLRMYEQISSALPTKLFRVVPIPSAGVTVNVEKYAVLTERDVFKAELHPTSGGSAILLKFEAVRTMRMDELTTRNRGRYIVTFLNDHPVAAWFVDRRIENGEMLIEGDFTEKEAKEAVESLNRQSEKRNRDW
jgi:preprotein translocase subunit SecD